MSVLPARASLFYLTVTTFAASAEDETQSCRRANSSMPASRLRETQEEHWVPTELSYVPGTVRTTYGVLGVLTAVGAGRNQELQ
jgi:hypothetical protein